MLSYRSLLFLITAATCGLMLQPAYGQRGGAGGGTNPSTGTGGNTGTGTGRGGNPGTGTPSTPTPTTPQPDTNRPTIFLTGRVMLDDGSQPAERVAIVQVCYGRTRTEGYTDSKGYFSIQMGPQAPQVFQDASNDSTLGFPGNSNTGRLNGGGGNSSTQMDLMNCELRGQLAGYESQSVNLGIRRSMDNPDVGVILMHRLGGSEGASVSATTLQAPKDARKAYEKASELIRKKKLDEARANLEKAVMLYPRYAAAWCDLGRLQAQMGDANAARNSFQQAISADSKFLPPYVELAMLETRAEQWQQAADTSQKAIELNPFQFPQAVYVNAVANYNLHNLDRAEESARKAEKLDTRHEMPGVSHLLGVILAQKQDYNGAAEELRTYLKLAPQAPDAAAVRSQLSQIEAQAKTTAAPPQ